MLLGNAAQGPQGVLQSLGQRHKTFTAEHDMGVFEAGKGKTEVIEPMIQRLAGDGDAKIAHVGEVGQSHPARRMLLTEDHLLIRAVQPPPRSDAPLQRPPDPGAEFRMPADQFLENGRWDAAQARLSEWRRPRRPKRRRADRADAVRVAPSFVREDGGASRSGKRLTR